jgi:hypothetical protein
MGSLVVAPLILACLYMAFTEWNRARNCPVCKKKTAVCTFDVYWHVEGAGRRNLCVTHLFQKQRIDRLEEEVLGH